MIPLRKRIVSKEYLYKKGNGMGEYGMGNQNGKWGYLLFWPVYLLRYIWIEAYVPKRGYYVMHCSLDDRIPFCEWFLIPYVLWYAGITGMHVYTLLRQQKTYIRYSKYLIWATVMSTGIFLLFPSRQMLRPETFVRRNILVNGVELLYCLDTGTNVFPSEHVILSIGVFMAALHTEKFQTAGRLFAIGIGVLLVCMATVFLKQHSVLDILGAVPVSLTAYLLACGGRNNGS